MGNEQTAVDIAILKMKQMDLEERLELVEKESAENKAMANRWKGGAAVLIFLGTIAGAALSKIEWIKALIGWKTGG